MTADNHCRPRTQLPHPFTLLSHEFKVATYDAAAQESAQPVSF
ncbi:hypothetical protein ACS7SF_27090 (plasmid) [Ralstonia sp. 25C]